MNFYYKKDILAKYFAEQIKINKEQLDKLIKGINEGKYKEVYSQFVFYFMSMNEYLDKIKNYLNYYKNNKIKLNLRNLKKKYQNPPELVDTIHNILSYFINKTNLFDNIETIVLNWV